MVIYVITALEMLDSSVSRRWAATKALTGERAALDARNNRWSCRGTQ